MTTILVALITGETWARAQEPFVSSAVLYDCIPQRRAETDMVLAAACAGGCCRPGVRPRLLVTEIELRFRLDDRVAIGSADGRADPDVTYDSRGCPNIEAQLDDPRLVALGDPPFARTPMCRVPGRASSIGDAWDGARVAPDGWRWDPPSGLMIRVCTAR
jgi:hypothetical protein